ncbi:MAG TPA: SGNH/GDSL hydrolase family protein [Tepidisphaeraceae bacterium]|nr:SGNH/GDSL hydrolase family protein [Tepidisphaeraceae bacterium]
MKTFLASAALSLAAFAIPFSTPRPAAAQDQGLKQGDYVAIVGDSITEQKLYSVFMEDYLLMCKPQVNLKATQFGWGGETSWGFGARMYNDMIPFGANVATTCFGMNDGGYSPQSPQKAQRYYEAQTSVVEQMKKAGVRFIVVGSPGCVDSDTFGHNPAKGEMYNATLASERDIAKKVAQEQGVTFADVFTPMYDAMAKAKAKYGHEYDVCGHNDGIHPGPNGHLIMAYAFLKALGCDGNIGTFTVNLGDNKAELSPGHELIWFGNGRLSIESSKYPFCFYGDPKSSSSTSGITEFFPFNQDLNRLMLIVSDAKADQNYKITWGEESKTFKGEQLSKGINLAAEFINNPFSEPFKKVEEQIRHQQNFETPLVKQSIHGLIDCQRAAGEERNLLEGVRSILIASDLPLRVQSELSVKPVRHTITIEEAGQ